MHKQIGLFVGLLIAAPIACAQGTKPPPNIDAVLSYLYHYRPSYDECIRKAGTSMYAMVACTNAELAYQDRRLNKAYVALIAKLSPEGQAKLKADENIWMKYRDTNCSAGPDGLDRPVGDAESCKLMKTAEQATDLEAMLDIL
ncbi:DUF1311 domain-containing protein [Dyella dinghuensis]|uniref:DUF1311 domain-containing protein n=1 Tax=Dyella dinghuensis TaxID=1920169 RepID=A0A3S0RSB8_9GAMM|nr:lysozyme inhibitor LprI family protein [Dyella dinghuensis]RUL63145.1 DUF1311 domain-containing protein [Dyella dinghuensis]